jgi:glycosyltransferase involved in cell wall biosynthesis
VRVSFIIPTRNQAAFIGETLDSCLAQGLEDFEIVVVDGASTDGTQAVLAGYSDRIRWVSEPDRGLADGVNKGVAMATGELIAWINSDDYYPHAGVLKRVLSFFEQDPELDLLYGDGLMVDVRGNVIRPHRSRPYGGIHGLLLPSKVFVMQPAVFFRKQLLLDAGGVDPSWPSAPDYELWLRLFPQARKLRYVPEYFACTRMHLEAGTVREMTRLISAMCAMKRRYAGILGLGVVDRLRMYAGVLWLYAYYAAVRVGLRRTV